MMVKDLEEESEVVVPETKEGPITKKEWKELMSSIRSDRDLLSDEECKGLKELYRNEGAGALTKRQYVQIYEYNLFAATGTTRDF